MDYENEKFYSYYLDNFAKSYWKSLLFAIGNLDIYEEFESYNSTETILSFIGVLAV